MNTIRSWIFAVLAVCLLTLAGCCGGSGEKTTVVEKQPVVVQEQAPLGDQLIKLKEAHDQGALTDEEYEAAKKKILAK